ncbi:hypothetical protein GF420_04205 [candidate division GN15 bacterium]|nr:hypothetical protein [candidate division GN15 bacterium]
MGMFATPVKETRRSSRRAAQTNFRTDAMQRLESKMRRQQKRRLTMMRRWKLSEPELADLSDSPELFDLSEVRA